MKKPKPNPTVHDVAAKAKVSLATVDRVIHKRGKPRTATIERVMNAIEELDYKPNKAAIQLVRGRSWKIGFVVPDFGITFLSQLMVSVEELREAFEDHGAQIETARIESSNALEFARKFERFAKTKDACVVLAPKDPAIVEVVRKLESQRKPVATLISDLSSSERTLYAGPDNFNMGAVAAQSLLPLLRKSHGIVFIAKTSNVQEDHNARHAGFVDALMQNGFDKNRIRILDIENETNHKDICAQLSKLSAGEPVSAVYTTGGSTKVMTLAVRQILGTDTAITVTDLTDNSRAMLLEGQIDYIVSSDSIASVRSAVFGLIKKLNEPHWTASQKSMPIQLFTRSNLPDS